jgi:hypothetical protein
MAGNRRRREDATRRARRQFIKPHRGACPVCNLAVMINRRHCNAPDSGAGGTVTVLASYCAAAFLHGKMR